VSQILKVLELIEKKAKEENVSMEEAAKMLRREWEASRECQSEEEELEGIMRLFKIKSTQE
jgi:hypothetical protein